MKKQLKRTLQCAKCPWKVSTNPFDIPDGYCEIKHANLKDTISNSNDLGFNKPIKAMACHHSKDLQENAQYCVGWLHNQLGVGNNIPLRLQMMNYDNVKDIEVFGEQHLTFNDTLPKKK